MHQTATLWGKQGSQDRNAGGSFEDFSHLITKDFAHWCRHPAVSF